jgi:hypothetical protein
MYRTLFSMIFVVVCIVSGPARGALIIDVGDHILQANQAGQQIQIFVSGGDQVQGLNLNAQIHDGSDAAVAPVFQNVDIVTGTIFAGNHNPPNHIGDLPRIQVWSMTTASGTVPAQGLLATFTINTTGLFAGTWDLRLRDTLNGHTDFAGTPATITNGSISIAVIPEPSVLALVCVAGLGILPARVLRRRKF